MIMLFHDCPVAIHGSYKMCIGKVGVKPLSGLQSATVGFTSASSLWEPRKVANTSEMDPQPYLFSNVISLCISGFPAPWLGYPRAQLKGEICTVHPQFLCESIMVVS